MSGSEFVFDTNIFLYLQSGHAEMVNVFNESSVFVSVITELELLGFKDLNPIAEAELRRALKSCFIVDIEGPIKDIAIDLRKRYNLKLPDAIIASTAIHLQIPLITADKGFENVEGLILYLYQVTSPNA
jgi:predicted nucleic acid-binding protein